jgi:lipopolysaccharide heptosyltransferase III
MSNILIYRLGSIGDTIVALPCFHQIARAYPDARRIIITNFPVSEKAAALEQVLGGSGLIHGSVAYPTRLRNPFALVRLIRKIRAIGAGALIYLPSSRGRLATIRDVVFFRICGVKRFVGASMDLDYHLCRKDPQTGTLEREAERLVRCMAELGPIDLNAPEMWDLKLRPEELAAAERFLAPLKGQKFVAIHIGGKSKKKEWGEENWTNLLRSVTERHPELALVLVGATIDTYRSTRLGAVWLNTVLNACGKLTPRECVALLERATLFVGHDSGPMHMAASRGAPCVAIFGDYNFPRRWHPYGAGHHILHNTAGIHLIHPEEVLLAVENALAEGADEVGRSKEAGSHDQWQRWRRHHG